MTAAPRMLTAVERQNAAQDQELARRRAERLRRFLRRDDLGSAAREMAEVELDDADREASLLGTLLSARTGWTWARFASSNDTIEERPYSTSWQEVAP